MPSWWIDIWTRGGLLGTEGDRLAAELRAARRHLQDLYDDELRLRLQVEYQEAEIKRLEGRRWMLEHPPYRGRHNAPSA
jgi:hypothetical protein